jgi:CubicO group peptidase (beta-lactamase class C family)
MSGSYPGGSIMSMIDRVQTLVAHYAQTWTEEAIEIDTYLASQVSDDSHREILGPLKPASGASGVVLLDGREAASWGDPEVSEMAFSATKSVVSAVAGCAFDDGLLEPGQPVHEVVDVEATSPRIDPRITWTHLLQQTSQWEGELWGKPTSVDSQSFREGAEVHSTSPGEGWAYNDVRLNLLTYALTLLFGRTLEEVLRDRLLGPLGASESWVWHGYTNSYAISDSHSVPVVSGGAHWGGGLVISARDLARVGQLYLNAGVCEGQRLLSTEWIEQSWTPCRVKPEYGYLWWLNDLQIPWPEAPKTGRSARGNGGRHLLWVDPARNLVLCSRWTEHPASLIRDLSALVPTG